jgi:hypothetical protein
MYCGKCGSKIQEGQNFCNRCGQSIGAATSPTSIEVTPVADKRTNSVSVPVQAQYSSAPHLARVAKHLQILGILWIVASFLRLIPALGMMFFGRIGFQFVSGPLRAFVMPFIGGMATFIALTALVGFIVGWGLLDRRPWARILAIVFGCIKLIEIPFGTALGIYTLWVLASQGAEQEYQRLARVRA